MLFFQKNHQEVDHDRRRMLRAAAGATLGLIAAPALAVPSRSKEHQLAFYNTHTGESLKTVYRANGHYIAGALRDINRILRDYRTDKVAAIDPKLLDILYHLRYSVGSRSQLHIISGYRSPETNATMHEKSRGVAKKSLHMEGKAIDIRLPGTDLAQVRKAAIALKRGGVGYYPRSEFVHVDTGKIRTW